MENMMGLIKRLKFQWCHFRQNLKNEVLWVCLVRLGLNQAVFIRKGKKLSGLSSCG